MVSNFYPDQSVDAHLGPASQRRHQQHQCLHSEHLFSPPRSSTIALCEQWQYCHSRSSFTASAGAGAGFVIGASIGAVS